MRKRLGKISLILLILLLGLSAVFLISVRFPAVQTYLAQRATAILSKSLHTKVSIEKVNISFFNQVNLVNFYMEDHRDSVLIAAKELTINYKVLALLDKKVNITDIELNEGTFHLFRDSAGVLNLTELFVKPGKEIKNETPANKVDTTQSLTWDIDLDDLVLTKTDFRFRDEKDHQDIKVLLAKAEVNARKFNLKNKLIDIKSIQLDGADIALETLKHLDDNKKGPEEINETHFLKGGAQLKLGEVSITNSRFRVTNHNVDTVAKKGIDFKHLDVSGINLLAENVSIIADTVSTHITSLSAKERSGFTLLNLTTDAHVSVNDITLDKLHVKTPESDIRKYLSFRFANFDGFSHFADSVSIKADFANTRVSLKDLNYFLRALDKIEHNRITINGEISGKVNALKGRGMELSTADNTTFKGDFYMKGLPDIYETSLNLRVARLATSAGDIRRIYPALALPANINTLGVVYYSGSLDGFLTDFVSTGKLYTAIGTATTDVNFKYDRKKNKSSYEGLLALNEFDLGKYFNDEKNLGKVSLETKIDGRGITTESLHAGIEGNISSITLLRHEYKDIKINGLVEKKSFSGSLKVKDEFLVMDFEGKVDLMDTTPQFNFNANIQKAQLKNLNLMQDDIRIAGRMNSNFKGSNFENINGSIVLNDMVVSRDSIKASVKHFSLNTKTFADRSKTILLNSDFAEAEIKGNFNYRTLPKALTEFVTASITRDDSKVLPDTVAQNFTADITIYEPGNISRIIYPKLNFIHQSRIYAEFNSTKQLNLIATIPELTYDQYTIRESALNVTIGKDSFDIKARVDKVLNDDNQMLDSVVVISKTRGEDIQFDISVADKNHATYGNITAYLTPSEGKAVIQMMPSDVKLGNYHWHFLPNNSIFVEGKKITTNNLAFKTQNQTLYISSYLKNDTSTSVKLLLDNTDVGDFLGIFSQGIKDLEGNASGKLIVEDIFTKPQIYADVVVSDFTLGGELIGDVNLETKLDDNGKKLDVLATVKSVNNLIQAKGYVSLDANKPGMKIDLDADRVRLNLLNYKFFDRYVKNCHGYITAHASFTGTFDKPLLTGEVLLLDDTVTVSFLNTAYHLRNQRVTLDEHGINLGALTFYDVRDKVIYGSGRINHENFRNFELDLRVTSPDMQFLNTTAKESPGFYGVAYGTGNVKFFGDINSPSIRAYAKTLPGTWCKMPITSSLDAGRYGFYRFQTPERNRRTNSQNSKRRINGVDFVLELDATPDARMDIILDPIAGDVLSTYGSGNLKIEIPKGGNTTMYGNYEIESGKYLFTLQNITNKPFEIRRGSTINFIGDIDKARLDIDAVYEIRSSVADLIEEDLKVTSGSTNTGQSTPLAAARNRVAVKLLLNLTGILEQPSIAFDVEVSDMDPTIKSYVEQKLAYLKANESEMNKQVFGILVMNKFLPVNSNFTSTVSSANNISGTGINTLGQMLSSQLNRYMDEFFEYTGNNTLQNFDLNIGLQQYDQSTQGLPGQPGPGTSLETRRELQLAISQRLLNNRLSINAGGNLDFGSTTQTTGPTTSKSVIPTGDFQIEYYLTKDGRWRAKAFNRTNYDYFNARNYNRTGLGISYRQEFDKPAELFQKSLKKKLERDAKKKAKEEAEKQKTTQPVQPVPAPVTSVPVPKP